MEVSFNLYLTPIITKEWARNNLSNWRSIFVRLQGGQKGKSVAQVISCTFQSEKHNQLFDENERCFILNDSPFCYLKYSSANAFALG